MNANSGSHLLATFGAVTASVYAIFHFADPLTICGALCADLGAQATSAFVKFRADQHDVRGCSTDLGASHDQAEVLGFGMLIADLQAMSHRRRQARLIAAQTFLDAAFHFRVDAMHMRAPFLRMRPARRQAFAETGICHFSSLGWLGAPSQPSAYRAPRKIFA